MRMCTVCTSARISIWKCLHPFHFKVMFKIYAPFFSFSPRIFLTSCLLLLYSLSCRGRNLFQLQEETLGCWQDASEEWISSAWWVGLQPQHWRNSIDTLPWWSSQIVRGPWIKRSQYSLSLSSWLSAVQWIIQILLLYTILICSCILEKYYLRNWTFAERSQNDIAWWKRSTCYYSLKLKL